MLFFNDVEGNLLHLIERPLGASVFRSAAEPAEPQPNTNSQSILQKVTKEIKGTEIYGSSFPSLPSVKIPWLENTRRKTTFSDIALRMTRMDSAIPCLNPRYQAIRGQNSFR